MLDQPIDNLLPAPSRSERGDAISIAFTGHCTAHAVLGDGDGDGVRMQAETHHELAHAVPLTADQSPAASTDAFHADASPLGAEIGVKRHRPVGRDRMVTRALPAPSRAERDVAIASKGHCTAHAVLGNGAGLRMQAESHLELSHLFILNADPATADLQEQVRFRYGPRGAERTHVFDVVATRRCGTRIAYTIKPEVRLRSGRFVEEMRTVAWWVRETRFASDVRLLTDADVDPVALHNAKIFAVNRPAILTPDRRPILTLARREEEGLIRRSGRGGGDGSGPPPGLRRGS